MTKKPDNFLTQDEQKIYDDIHQGNYVPLDEGAYAAMKQRLEQAAAQNIRKDARINIRLSSEDLREIKLRANLDGIPYQTLISSILHRYVNDRLIPR